MKRSIVYKLDSFIDEKGLMRVEGRLRKSNLHFTDVHPILLNKDSCITRLIVKWCYQKTEDSPWWKRLTINEIKSKGFWVVWCNTIVRSLVRKCVKCRLLREKLGKQKMADLPTDRTIDELPLANCVVDMFGPFLIKKWRKEFTRYGALFKFLSSRAVECTCNLNKDSFIQTLRRFVAWKRNIRVLRSDNGSNFFGSIERTGKGI